MTHYLNALDFFVERQTATLVKKEIAIFGSADIFFCLQQHPAHIPSSTPSIPNSPGRGRRKEYGFSPKSSNASKWTWSTNTQFFLDFLEITRKKFVESYSSPPSPFWAASASPPSPPLRNHRHQTSHPPLVRPKNASLPILRCERGGNGPVCLCLHALWGNMRADPIFVFLRLSVPPGRNLWLKVISFFVGFFVYWWVAYFGKNIFFGGGV